MTMKTPLRILLVDDSAEHNIVLQAALRKFGHEVSVAGTTGEALEHIQSHPCDLVLLDLVLPDINGITAARLLRRRAPEEIRDKLVIAGMTASSDRALKDECRHVGMADLLNKPMRPRDLASTIERLMTIDRCELPIAITSVPPAPEEGVSSRLQQHFFHDLLNLLIRQRALGLTDLAGELCEAAISLTTDMRDLESFARGEWQSEPVMTNLRAVAKVIEERQAMSWAGKLPDIVLETDPELVAEVVERLIQAVPSLPAAPAPVLAVEVDDDLVRLLVPAEGLQGDPFLPFALDRDHGRGLLLHLARHLAQECLGGKTRRITRDGVSWLVLELKR